MMKVLYFPGFGLWHRDQSCLQCTSQKKMQQQKMIFPVLEQLILNKSGKLYIRDSTLCFLIYDQYNKCLQAIVDRTISETEPEDNFNRWFVRA